MYEVDFILSSSPEWKRASRMFDGLKKNSAQRFSNSDGFRTRGDLY